VARSSPRPAGADAAPTVVPYQRHADDHHHEPVPPSKFRFSQWNGPIRVATADGQPLRHMRWRADAARPDPSSPRGRSRGPLVADPEHAITASPRAAAAAQAAAEEAAAAARAREELGNENATLPDLVARLSREAVHDESHAGDGGRGAGAAGVAGASNESRGGSDDDVVPPEWDAEIMRSMEARARDEAELVYKERYAKDARELGLLGDGFESDDELNVVADNETRRLLGDLHAHRRQRGSSRSPSPHNSHRSHSSQSRSRSRSRSPAQLYASQDGRVRRRHPTEANASTGTGTSGGGGSSRRRVVAARGRPRGARSSRSSSSMPGMQVGGGAPQQRRATVKGADAVAEVLQSSPPHTASSSASRRVQSARRSAGHPPQPPPPWVSRAPGIRSNAGAACYTPADTEVAVHAWPNRGVFRGASRPSSSSASRAALTAASDALRRAESEDVLPKRIARILPDSGGSQLRRPASSGGTHQTKHHGYHHHQQQQQQQQQHRRSPSRTER
jgi:hypothetical protein